jgi:hypothetical protein
VCCYFSYDYPAADLADLQAVMHRGMLAAGFSPPEADLWTASLVAHHQWMCVSVEHALVLLALREKILKVSWAVMGGMMAAGGSQGGGPAAAESALMGLPPAAHCCALLGLC